MEKLFSRIVEDVNVTILIRDEDLEFFSVIF